MKTRAFYNETDPYCCDWLSNLMDAGHITPGRIDNRPIQELRDDDVRGYGRVHFFAGIAGWDRALDLAFDLRRGVGMGGEDEHHHLRAANGVDDRLAPVHPVDDVARRDPATDAFGLELGAGRVRLGLVLLRIADERVERHPRPARGLWFREGLRRCGL